MGVEEWEYGSRSQDLGDHGRLTYQPGGHISLAPMTASCRIDRGTELLVGAPKLFLTDMEATMGTYQLRSYGDE